MGENLKGNFATPETFQNEILGSGNFDIEKGGTYYDDNEAPSYSFR